MAKPKKLAQDSISPELSSAFGKEVLMPFLQSIHEFALNHEEARELGIQSLVMFIVTNTVVNCFHSFTTFPDVKERIAASQNYLEALMLNCKMHFMDNV